MIVLSCNNITKAYAADNILEGVTFSIEEGEKVGVVGLNGSGKSTLFNILAGETTKDKGDIYIQKGLKIGYLKQHTNIQSDNTVFEECVEVLNDIVEMEKRMRNLEIEIGLEGKKGTTERLNKLMEEYSNLTEEFTKKNGYGFKSEIKGILKGLGFDDKDMDKPVNKLSGGQKARLSLAKLLLEKPDVLLLDEPTNHLDIDGIGWLEKYLLEYKGAALIISHDRYFLDNVVSRIFHLEDLNIKIYNGNYTEYMEKRKKELEILKKGYENQKKEIERQEEIIRRFMSYGGSRYVRQAKSRQKMLDKMKKIDKPPADNKKVKIRFEPKVESGREVLTLENIEKTFDDFTLLKDISFNIYRGEKVGLIGPNGIGKTTLFRMILGDIKPTDGQILLGHRANIGYFDQEQRKLNLEKTVMDEIWDENPDLDYYQIRTILSQFLFIGDDIFKEVKELSGGERSRLALLKLMMSRSNFLLMDEPTNHLDIDSKEVLEDALQNYDGTLLVISHDRYFLNKVVDKILELSKDGITEYLGNYNYYVEKKNQIIDCEDGNDGKTKTQMKIERKKEREKKENKKKKKAKVLEIERTIEENEEKVKEIDKLMCDQDIFTDSEKMKELVKERKQTKDYIDKLYDKWIQMTENR